MRKIMYCFCLVIMCACANVGSLGTEVALPKPVLAEGVPKEKFEGNYDYLKFALDGETYFDVNTVKGEATGIELNLERYSGYYISAIEAYSTKKYNVFFYYQTNFDYGFWRCAVIDKSSLEQIKICDLPDFNPYKYSLYEEQVFWLNNGTIVCYNVVNGLKIWEARIPIKQFTEEDIYFRLYTDSMQLYLKNKKIGSVDLKSGKWR